MDQLSQIDNIQQKRKYRLCGDKDATINHMSECSKHDWVGEGYLLRIVQVIDYTTK